MLRLLFFCLIVRPVAFVLLGLNIRHRERLPTRGPAIIIANHNSHLDTLVLMSLFPARDLRAVRPVAAADYWLKNGRIAWFANHIIRIIPIARDRVAGEDPLAVVDKAVDDGSIVIFFPEGTRGEPERLSRFRSGIARLAERHPGTPIVPIFLHGLGKSLPRGEGLLVPFNCDVYIGEAVYGRDHRDFLPVIEKRVAELAEEGHANPWE